MSIDLLEMWLKVLEENGITFRIVADAMLAYFLNLAIAQMQ